MLHQPANVLAVFGTRSEAHPNEALTARELELTPGQVAWVEAGVEA